MSAHRRFVRFGVTALLTLVMAPLVSAVTLPTGNAASDYLLRKTGELAHPAFAPPRDDEGAIAAVDAKNRRLYYVYSDKSQLSHVLTYDLRPRVPKPIAVGALAPEVNVFPPSPYSVAVDTKRKQLVFITGNVDVDGHAVTLGNPSISIYSDTTNKVTEKWELPAKLPGFYPFGVTYSEADDRLYFVGEFAGSQYVAASTYTFGSKAAGAVASVVAMDPATGNVLWMRQLPHCQQALFTLNVGGLIARSRLSNALYFACVSGGTSDGKTYPGQAGLIRLHIDPKATDSAAAAQFPFDFYAISGNYFNGAYSGIAAFDARTDRFYLQSLAPRTPGAWVFDGQLSAWVGFVSAPSAADRFIGLNERLGHLYIGTFQGAAEPNKTDGLLIANVRQTPVPAGEFVPIATNAFIATDSATNRLFVQPYHAPRTLAPYEVYEDLTPVTDGPEPVDYDADTTDTPDTPAAQVSYSASAAGYGMQAVLVGGTGGALSGPGRDIPGVAPGTRAVMAARLGNLDLRAGGATAATQAVVADINTVQYYEGERKEPWPYPTTTCLDSTGEPSSQSFRDDGTTGPANGGTSSVECDLAKANVRAASRMGVVGSGGVTAGRSSYDARAYRNTAEGAVVLTHTAAEAITFEMAGGYKLRLGRVAATTKTAAHGRPGTTYANWQRAVEGVQLVDANDNVVQALPGCTSSITLGPEVGRRAVHDTCVDLGDKLSRVLPTRLKVSFPLPHVAATPRGAFAGVEQTEAEYYQQRVVNDQGVTYRIDSVGVRPNPAAVIEIYNDSTERSRTVTVLAATQASAIFTVVPAYQQPPQPPLPTDQPVPTPGPGSGTGGPTTPGLRPNGTDGDDGDGAALQPTAAPPGTVAAPATELTGFLFLRRSLRDAVLLVLLAGLLLSGAGTYWRRRRLVQVLVTVPGKAAQ